MRRNASTRSSSSAESTASGASARSGASSLRWPRFARWVRTRSGLVVWTGEEGCGMTPMCLYGVVVKPLFVRGSVVRLYVASFSFGGCAHPIVVCCSVFAMITLLCCVPEPAA